MMVLEVSLMAAVQNDMLVVTTTSESAEGMRLQVAQQHANWFLLRKPPDRLSRGRDCIKKTHPYPYGNIV